jgi:hypothetical protein
VIDSQSRGASVNVSHFHPKITRLLHQQQCISSTLHVQHCFSIIATRQLMSLGGVRAVAGLHQGQPHLLLVGDHPVAARFGGSPRHWGSSCTKLVLHPVRCHCPWVSACHLCLHNPPPPFELNCNNAKKEYTSLSLKSKEVLRRLL